MIDDGHLGMHLHTCTHTNTHTRSLARPQNQNRMFRVRSRGGSEKNTVVHINQLNAILYLCQIVKIANV